MRVCGLRILPMESGRNSTAEAFRAAMQSAGIPQAFERNPMPEPVRSTSLFVGAAAFLNARRVQVAQLAAFYRLPAAYALREAAEVGGLMSYGPSIVDAYRQWGVYAGRILKGAKPVDLPVMQASKFELVFNLTTARLLGLEIPATVLARADEVIE